MWLASARIGPHPARLRRLVAVCLIAALLAAPDTSAQVRVVETLPVPEESSTQNVSHQLQLSMVTFLGTRWTVSDIQAAVRDAAPLLAQCGITLARSALHILEAPRRFHFYSTSVSRELLGAISVATPAVFFVEDTLHVPGYDAEAIGVANSVNRRELANTVWVAHGARDLPHVLAHELVHVLADNGEHSDEPGNLMRAETSPLNRRLSAAQCERVRAHGMANGLLTARDQPPRGGWR